MRTRLLTSRLLLAVLLAGLVLPAAAKSPAEPAAVRPDVPYYFEDFEADNGGYVSVGDHRWTWGPPPAGLAPPHSGVNVWATESPYVSGPTYEVGSPWIDLTGADPTHDLVLDWWQKLDIEPVWEFAYVDVSTDGSDWKPVWFGSSVGAWENVTADLSAYIGQTIMLRFRMTYGYPSQRAGSAVYAGWAIDDVGIYSGAHPFPAIAVDAPPLSVTLCPDQQQALAVQICNTGVGALNWSLSEPWADGPAPATRLTGQKSPASSPPAVGMAPGHAAPVPAAASVLAGRAYAFELFGAHLYHIPDLDTPGTWNLVGGVIPTTFAGAFKGSDYSQEYVIDNNARQLWTVNTTTGATTLIGPCVPKAGDRWWTGMSWDETTDTMYAFATDCGSHSGLYTLDLATGAPTKVVNITGALCIIDIAVDTSGQMYGHDMYLDSLMWINKLTGAATIIGSTGFDASYQQGMDFDDTTGTLYLAAYNVATGAELRIANLNTGATTLVGAFPGQEVDAFAIVGPIPDTTWLSEDPAGGAVPPGECVTVTVTFDSTGLAPGVYEAELLLNNDDPHTPRISLPVQMTVAEAPSILDVAYQTTGFEVTFNATVTGTAPLTYTWAFGDGGTSNVVDPTHVYAHGGCYTPTLTLTNGYCEDTWQEQICLYRTYYLPIVVKSL
jgi:PKD domain/Repeat of unknown function (DUF6923)